MLERTQIPDDVRAIVIEEYEEQADRLACLRDAFVDGQTWQALAGAVAAMRGLAEYYRNGFRDPKAETELTPIGEILGSEEVRRWAAEVQQAICARTLVPARFFGVDMSAGSDWSAPLQEPSQPIIEVEAPAWAGRPRRVIGKEILDAARESRDD